MSRREPDWIDLICNDWAREKRKYLGIVLPKHLMPNERIGKLRCTLGAMIAEGPGAGHSTGGRNYPEVFTGDAVVVNQIWHAMPQGLKKLIIWAHYVFHEVPVTVIAQEFQIDKEGYYQNFNAVKADLDAQLKRMGIKQKSEIL